MNELVLTAKAFADPTRIRILRILDGGELCVCELCEVLGLNQSTLSTHLQVIRAAGLVVARKEGKWMYYNLAPAAMPLLESVFGHFRGSLGKHPRLVKDRSRLGEACGEGVRCGVGGKGRQMGEVARKKGVRR